jgi:hypothetical protein
MLSHFQKKTSLCWNVPRFFPFNRLLGVTLKVEMNVKHRRNPADRIQSTYCRRNTYASASLSKTKPIWISFCMNADRSGKRPAKKHWSYGRPFRTQNWSKQYWKIQFLMNIKYCVSIWRGFSLRKELLLPVRITRRIWIYCARKLARFLTLTVLSNNVSRRVNKSWPKERNYLLNHWINTHCKLGHYVEDIFVMVENKWIGDVQTLYFQCWIR